MEMKDIKHFLTQFTKKDLFLWLSITATCPFNQKYIIIFSKILAILVSVNESEFSNNVIQETPLIDFIRQIIKNNRQLIIEEIYLKGKTTNIKMPIFYDGIKYYIFNGHLNQTFENTKNFIDIYLNFLNEDKPAWIIEIEKMFKASIKFQNKIVVIFDEFINKKKLIEVLRQDNFSTPSKEYYDALIEIFIISKDEINDYKQLNSPNIKINHDFMDGDNLEYLNAFRDIYFQFAKNEIYYMSPNMHISILYNLTEKYIKEGLNNDRIVILQNAAEFRVRQLCKRFFLPRNCLLGVIVENPFEDLTKNIDAIMYVNNKIILFKLVKFGNDKKESPNFTEARKALSETITLIKSKKTISMISLDKMGMSNINTENIEFVNVILYEILNKNYQMMLLNTLDKDDFHLLELSQVQEIFDTIKLDFEINDWPLIFLKFLQEDNYLKKNTRAVTLDFRDKFAFYITNGQTFIRSGTYPSVIFFSPGTWEDYYFDKIIKKYEDNIYELVEHDFPNFFEYISKRKENIYEVIDLVNINGGIVVKFETTLVWVINPTEIDKCTPEEMDVAVNLLGPLFSDYLDRLRFNFIQLFEKYGLSIKNNYRIVLYPKNMIVKIGNTDYSKRHLDNLSVEEPIIFITDNQHINNAVVLRTSVLFDVDYLMTLFSREVNDGERFCIKELVRSLLTHFDKSLTTELIDKLAQNFIDDNVKEGIKGYSMDSIPISNPRLKDYRDFDRVLKADEGVAQREIARNIKDNQVKPGIYNGDDVKAIINSTCLFLFKKIKLELNKFNKDSLSLIFAQIELIEGERIMKSMRSDRDAKRYIEFDLVTKNMKLTSEIGRYATASRIILEIFLQLETFGTKFIDFESWSLILAYALELSQLMIMSDNIHFGISTYELEISDSFDIKDKIINERIDFESYLKKESKTEVERAYYNEYDIDNMESVSTIRELLTEIDSAFLKQYKFSFTTLINFLSAIESCSLFNEKSFPTSISTAAVLYDNINKNLKSNMDLEMFNQVLKFCSLSFDTYNKNELLVPGKILNRKERLSLSPIIDLNNTKYMFSNQLSAMTATVWRNYILIQNVMPYTIADGSPIQNALKKIHKIMDKKLEINAEKKVKEFIEPKYVKARVSNFKQLSIEFNEIESCGEIDLMTLNQDNKIIFVFECKNRKKKIGGHATRRELDEFFDGEHSYKEQLENKYNFINTNLDKILKHFKFDDVNGWKVEKAFIVNKNYFISHTKCENITFVTISELKDYIFSKRI